jgi:hypothetical protein
MHVPGAYMMPGELRVVQDCSADCKLAGEFMIIMLCTRVFVSYANRALSAAVPRGESSTRGTAALCVLNRTQETWGQV